MTLEEIKQSDELVLKAEDFAHLLGAKASSIRAVANERPDRLGYEVTFTAEHSPRFPRIPWLKFFGEYEEKEKPATKAGL